MIIHLWRLYLWNDETNLFSEFLADPALHCIQCILVYIVRVQLTELSDTLTQHTFLCSYCGSFLAQNVQCTFGVIDSCNVHLVLSIAAMYVWCYG